MEVDYMEQFLFPNKSLRTHEIELTTLSKSAGYFPGLSFYILGGITISVGVFSFTAIFCIIIMISAYYSHWNE